MRVLVVGAAGQLGQVAVTRLSAAHDVIGCTRADVDVTDHAALTAFVRDARPDAIVNCVAFNDVDGAEDRQQHAFAVNAFAPRSLARVADELDAVFIHYSTDFVFSGAATAPYTEEDSPEPQSVYAQSKLVGEWMAAGCRRYFVVRVESLFGGVQARSSVDRIITAVRSGAEARVFFDRVVSPSFTADVAGALEHLLSGAAPFGLYHCVNSGQGTWLEVGREIARLLGRAETCLTPVSVNDVQLRAPRPQYAALSNRKLAAAGYDMPSWQDALARYLGSRTTV